MPEASSAVNASWASPVWDSESARGVPTTIVKVAATRAAMTMSVPSNAAHRARTPPRAPRAAVRPCRPATDHRLLADARPVDARSDAGEDHRQQRGGDEHADQRDEHSPKADAAQERHRQDEH